MLNQYSFGQNPIVLARKSFTGYIVPMGAWLIIWLAASAFSDLLSIALLLIGVIVFLYIRSYQLFVDDAGVWVFRGVFPWDKGIYGLRWEEFGLAVFYQNPWSWILRSYAVQVKNKYKEEVILDLSNMHRGDIAISRINAMAM